MQQECSHSRPLKLARLLLRLPIPSNSASSVLAMNERKSLGHRHLSRSSPMQSVQLTRNVAGPMLSAGPSFTKLCKSLRSCQTTCGDPRISAPPHLGVSNMQRAAGGGQRTADIAHQAQTPAVKPSAPLHIEAEAVSWTQQEGRLHSDLPPASQHGVHVAVRLENAGGHRGALDEFCWAHTV